MQLMQVEDKGEFASCDCQPPGISIRQEVQSTIGNEERQAPYSLNNSRRRLVWARLTGISVCFLSSMRSM